MPETSPPPAALAGLAMAEIARFAAGRPRPPVERWEPPFCGSSGMAIAADGSWTHDGAPIARPAMVRLFASLLRREADGGYVLVTPAEKLSIAVAELPFVAVEVTSEGEGRDRRLAFRLNTDEPVIAEVAHPLRLGDTPPRLLVRPGLEAKIARPVFYELVDRALAEEAAPPGLWSHGSFFALDGQ